MKGSRRISVRLKQESLESLHNYCREAGCDVSRAVRRALEGFLNLQSKTKTAGVASRRLSPPEAVLDLYPQYVGWVRGDLRQERKRLFIELLAASFVCKRLYPRTKGVPEGYESLLQLCEFFGVD
jgi:hypothetical protein